MPLPRPIWSFREAPWRPDLGDVAGMAMAGALAFIFVWWLRFWLGWLIWLSAVAERVL